MTADKSAGIQRPLDVLRAVAARDAALDDAAARSFQDPVLWEGLFREGIAGILFFALKESRRPSGFAPAAWDALEDEYATVTGRNMVLARATQKIVEACEENRVPALILRGARLIRDVYPEMGMRPVTDIDAVFRRDDLARVRALLEGMGMRPHPACPLFFEDGPVYVDVHLDAAGFVQIPDPQMGLSLRDERVWKTSVAWQTGASYVRCLDRVHELIACALHAQEHSYSRLSWFMDAAFLVEGSRETGAFDWELFLEASLRRNFSKPVFFLLSYLKAHRLARVPWRVLEVLGRQPLNSWERRSLTALEHDRRREIFGEGLCFFSIRGAARRFLFLWYALFRPRPGTGRGWVSLFLRCARIAAAGIRGILAKVFQGDAIHDNIPLS